MVVRARAVVALLLLLLLTPLVAMPAAAAGADGAGSARTELTVDGWTYSWSAPDASDLEVRRTPSAPDALPAGVRPQTLDALAAAGAAGAAERSPAGQAAPWRVAADDPDGCSFSPDRWFAADFEPVCDTHDRCYDVTSSTDRLVCDQRFLQALVAECSRAYGAGRQQVVCSAVAGVYYSAVRRLGTPFYDGTGSPR